MLNVIVKAAAELSPEESAQSSETGRLAFAGEPSEDLGWVRSEWLVLGKLDGRVVSQAGILKREILVGGQPVTVGGVGGVSTHPEFQQRGFAEQVMRRAEVFMRDTLHAQFGLLVCAPKRVPYYSKFGWQEMTAPMYFDFSGEKRRFLERVMVLPLDGSPWPQGDVDLQGGPW